MDTEVKKVKEVKPKKAHKNRRLFSKALFKQSCKANGMMWLIITVAVCFMLACVMLISGTSNISSVKENIEDSIIEEVIDSSVRKGAISTYDAANEGEYLFDQVFVETFNRLNTPETYRQIADISDAATSAATELVTENVTERVTAEVTNRITGMVKARVTQLVTNAVSDQLSAEVKARVTELVTNEVTNRLTAEVQTRVTEMVTAEVTNRLGAEVQARVTEIVTDEVSARIQTEIMAQVQGEASMIQSEVTAAVAQDMTTPEAAEKITAKVASGSDVETATSEVTSEYTAIESERITNEHIAAATSALTTDEHKNAVAQQVLAEKQAEFTQTATAEIVTEEHKAEVANTVLAEKQAEFTQTATAEIVTDAHKIEVTNAVLAEKQAEYTQRATSEIVTDTHKTEVANSVLNENQATYTSTATAEIVTESQKARVADEVLAEYKDQYTDAAQQELADEIDEITSQAEAEITEIFTEVYVKPAYEAAVNAVIDQYTAESAAIVAINPDNQADSVYLENGEIVPPEYIEGMIEYLRADVMSVGKGEAGNSLSDYIASEERSAFRNERAYTATAMLVGQSMISEETVDELLDALAEFNVTREGYEAMGFDYDKFHTIAYEAAMDYQNKFSYECSLITEKPGTSEYDARIADIKESLDVSVAGSLLEKLPEDVASGIEELGKMDLYGLLVGSIFFKMAGLLLPIIYLIMASNNLVAGQVDSGSMAYILSTSTKRRQVTFTQGLYLIGSLLLMFVFTTITSIVCFGLTDVQTNLTDEKLLLINLGAFVVLFAMSGINFLASCWFDRSKKAMALGGGISMFFLVATMLGLFGSPVIPSVVRIGALNNFNYVSIISLFDVVSILDGTSTWIWKLGILIIIGVVGYILGDIKFLKKDLPL